ncbi:glycosyltransferase [Palleronia marisminoris]|uniref:glycosyltransferase n=1 Tax=Palleronia marisminoris TaxID=315423 RepID=UPI001586FA95|nr:glycosyltransferase family 2 protein [Palleronia marisminoris]
MSSKPLSIAVTMPTFRRPEGLGRLLDAVEKLEIPDNVDVRVVVCENDAEGRAGETLVNERIAAGYALPLECVVSDERGISQARNALIARTIDEGDCDYIAMIDDDEWPSPGWLRALVDVSLKTGAHISGGPVVSVFADENADPVVKECEDFQRLSYPTGEIAVVHSTANVLLRRDVFELSGRPPFNPIFSVTGGGDADFFYRVKAAGGKFAWSDDAEVTELVPETRSTRAWVMRRNFRRGANTSWRALRRSGRHRTLPRLFVLGTGAIVTYPFAALSPSAKTRFNAKLRLWRTFGYISGGLAQRRIDDYKIIHGK